MPINRPHLKWLVCRTQIYILSTDKENILGIIDRTLSCRKTALFGRRFKEYLGVKGRGSLVENIYLYVNILYDCMPS